MIDTPRHASATSAIQLRLDTQLIDPQIAALLTAHLQDMHATSPADSVHALNLDALRQPEVRFWAAWQGDRLLGCGALKRLDGAHAEIKSMRTDAAARGRGVGRSVLRQLMADARAQGVRRLSLETGTHAFFAPAHALYRSEGFVDCGPFGSYALDPHSHFMTRTI